MRIFAQKTGPVAFKPAGVVFAVVWAALWGISLLFAP